MKLDYIKESIRISKNEIKIKVMISMGKDGDFYVVVSPTLAVSGYGNTEQEAEESFNLNIELFCTDILELSNEKRELYLINLGFRKEHLKTKNYSTIYGEGNVMLNDFIPNTSKSAMLTAAF